MLKFVADVGRRTSAILNKAEEKFTHLAGNSTFINNGFRTQLQKLDDDFEARTYNDSLMDALVEAKAETKGPCACIAKGLDVQHIVVWWIQRQSQASAVKNEAFQVEGTLPSSQESWRHTNFCFFCGGAHGIW